MKVKAAVSNFFKGIIIGIANVIPGVSGGTMAVILNIFDTLIAVLSLDIPTIKKKWKDVLFLLIGMGVGIVALSFIMEFLLAHFPTQCNWFFSGIVFGSIPFILKKSGTDLKNITFSKVAVFLLTLAVMIVMFVFTDSVDKEGGMVLAPNVGTVLFMVLAGCVAAFCMIIPGISGSFMMVVIGAYATVISTINTLLKGGASMLATMDFSGAGELLYPFLMMLGFGIGVIVGLIFGAKLIKFLIKRFPTHTYLAILGLVVGSCPFLLGWDGLILVAVIGGGFTCSYLFGKSES